MTQSEQVESFKKELQQKAFDEQRKISSAYQKLALMHHPDKNKDDPLAEARFKALTDAFNSFSSEQQQSIPQHNTNQPVPVVLCAASKVDDDYFNRMLVELKNQYQDTDMTVTYVSDRGQSHSIRGKLEDQQDVKFKPIKVDGQEGVSVEINPARYMIGGAIDHSKRLELTADAGAKLFIAHATAKYPNDPQKGLIELSQQTSFCGAGSPDKIALDQMITEKLATQLPLLILPAADADKQKTLMSGEAEPAKSADAPSSSRVAQLKALHADRLATDQKLISQAPASNEPVAAPAKQGMGGG